MSTTIVIACDNRQRGRLCRGYTADTRAESVHEALDGALRRGWARDGDREVCPECSAEGATLDPAGSYPPRL